MSEFLMRLYSNTDQFDKALDICRQWIRVDSGQYRTLKIAKRVAKLSRRHSDGNEMLNSFLQDIKGKLPTRNYNRFAGAIKAYLATHPAEQPNKTAPADLVSLLKNGHKVTIQKKCRSFAEFLEKLALGANTVAVQSFMGRYGQELPPPKITTKTGSAFEILAQAINHTNIPFTITQDGYWAFYENGDKSKKLHYAASGDLFCTLWPVSRTTGRNFLNFGGRVSFTPEVKRHITSIQATFTVLEAIDDTGRNIPVCKMDTRWDNSTQIRIPLSVQQPPAKSIKKLRVKTQVKIATGETIPFELTFNDIPITNR